MFFNKALTVLRNSFILINVVYIGKNVSSNGGANDLFINQIQILIFWIIKIMKTLLVIAMLIIFASTQTTIVPKSQACACSNLLNKLDCQALNGCQWTPSNDTNSTNITIPLTGIFVINNLKESVLMLIQIQRPQYKRYLHFVDQ
mgnify:CR=1 FL=1